MPLPKSAFSRIITQGQIVMHARDRCQMVNSTCIFPCGSFENIFSFQLQRAHAFKFKSKVEIRCYYSPGVKFFTSLEESRNRSSS